MPFVNVSNLGGSICLVCMCVCVCVCVCVCACVCVCVCVWVRVYLVGLPLMVMAFASSTVISADLWISFFGWSGLCTAHPVP